ncbi:MAG TPA: Fe-Mn family superoxide dismutase [Candidatus Acidoferrales bacterium]|nr:Fe-Mn family superoxide dismutase [Candidatus Acidoferrales bacterium]
MIDQFVFKARRWNLSGLTGISDKTLETHFGLYEGYVKNTNLLREQIATRGQNGKPKGLDPAFAELERRLGFEYNGMRLHELYFDNLTTKPAELAKGGGLDGSLQRTWGSFEAWRSEFTAIGQMRGVGWAMLAQDPWSGDLSNHWIELHQSGNVAGFSPILVMDVWEHAWIYDYKPADRSGYVESFMANVDWALCEVRLQPAHIEGTKIA